MAASRVEWFLLMVEILVVFCVLLGMFTTTQSILYPWYESYDNPSLKNGSHDIRSFGIWTSRANYADNPEKPLNQFDHRINTVRAFELISIGVVFTALLLLINELFLLPKDNYTQERPYIAHRYYRAQYLCSAVQFDVLLITAWVYSTLIQLDWVGWPLILLICGAGLSGLSFGFVTFQVIYPPRQDSGNSRVTGCPLILLIVAMALAMGSIFATLGCLTSSHMDGKEDSKDVQTTLSILTNSYPRAAYKNAFYACFTGEFIFNLGVVLVLSLMVFVKTEIFVKRLTYISMSIIFAFYVFSLATTWLLSRAPVLMDPKVGLGP